MSRVGAGGGFGAGEVVGGVGDEGEGLDGAGGQAGGGEGGGGGGEGGGEGAEAVDEGFGEGLGVAAFDAEEEEHFEDFVVGEGGFVGEEAGAHASAVPGGTGATEGCGRAAFVAHATFVAYDGPACCVGVIMAGVAD